MHITKMHGLGNDYIYLNGLEGAPEDLPGLAVRLSDRHFGVGGDGVICIRPGRGGDFTMEMYNADGSRGAMCGNGIRCVGKYVYDKGLTRKTCLTIDTDAGPRVLELQVRGGRVEQVTVDMGIPALSPAVSVEAEGETYTVWPVDVGNPHGVVFCPAPEAVPLERVGPILEGSGAFPQRINVEFAAVRTRERLEARVWERGSGITLACGTGACAVLAAAVRTARCGRRAAGWRAGAGLGPGQRAHLDDRPGGDRVRGGGGLKAALRLEKYKKNHSTNGIFSSILKDDINKRPSGVPEGPKKGIGPWSFWPHLLYFWLGPSPVWRWGGPCPGG